MVTPSGRTSGGFRLYSEADIGRLDLVKRMKSLDFSLEEVRTLLDLLEHREGSASTRSDPGHVVDQLRMYQETVEARCETCGSSSRRPKRSPRGCSRSCSCASRGEAGHRRVTRRLRLSSPLGGGAGVCPAVAAGSAVAVELDTSLGVGPPTVLRCREDLLGATARAARDLLRCVDGHRYGDFPSCFLVRSPLEACGAVRGAGACGRGGRGGGVAGVDGAAAGQAESLPGRFARVPDTSQNEVCRVFRSTYRFTSDPNMARCCGLATSS